MNLTLLYLLFLSLPPLSYTNTIDSSIDLLIQNSSPPPLSNQHPPSLTELITTLSSLQRKPTCYRTAATSLIHHCKSLSTDIPDSDRVSFAIKLTICELDLIQQTPAVCRIESRSKECI